MKMKRPHMTDDPGHNLLILIATYVLALGILRFGDMSPFVVALMPCIAFTVALLVRR